MLKEYPACGQKPIEVECAECHEMINIKDAIWKDWPECAMLRQRGPGANVTVGQWNQCPACLPRSWQRFFCPSWQRCGCGHRNCLSVYLDVDVKSDCETKFRDRENAACRTALKDQIDNEGWTVLQTCWFCGQQCEGARVVNSSGYDIMDFQTCAACRRDVNGHSSYHEAAPHSSYNRITCIGGCGYDTPHPFPSSNPREFAPVCDAKTGDLTHYIMYNEELETGGFHKKTAARNKWNRRNWCVWPEMHHKRNLWSYGRSAAAGNVYERQENRFCQDCIELSRSKRMSTPPDNRRTLHPRYADW